MSPKARDERAAEARLREQGFTIQRSGAEIVVTGPGFTVRTSSLLDLVRRMDRHDPAPVR